MAEMSELVSFSGLSDVHPILFSFILRPVVVRSGGRGSTNEVFLFVFYCTVQ
jgi:hypothetical protein